MMTVIRNTPWGTKVFHEYTPQELEAARLERESQLIASGVIHKSPIGAIDASQFVPDQGRKIERRNIV